MYLWNIKALADDLKGNRVSPKEQFKYFLLISLLMNASWLPASNEPIWVSATLSWLNFAVGMIICTLGIVYCYKANKQGDNQFFITRMTCLSVPICFRLALLYIVTIIIGGFIIFVTGIYHDRFLVHVFQLITNGIFTALGYLWARNYIIYIAAAPVSGQSISAGE